MYMRATGCPFPIYTDPSRRLYSILGLTRTLSLGSNAPNYIHHSLMVLILKAIAQGLRRIWAGDMLKGGDLKQVGGEFLFETAALGKGQGDVGVQVTWCHRMKNTRDHAEVPIIRHVLGLDSE